jgi:hypothetical protein
MNGKTAVIAITAAFCLWVAPASAKTASYSVRNGTGPNGRWGEIVRKATVTNRNIRVRFTNGANPLLAVPMNAIIRKDGHTVSIHNLSNGDRVHVWAVRYNADKAMHVRRIEAFSKKAVSSKR